MSVSVASPAVSVAWWSTYDYTPKAIFDLLHQRVPIGGVRDILLCRTQDIHLHYIQNKVPSVSQ